MKRLCLFVLVIAFASGAAEARDLLKEMEKLEAQVKYLLANPLPACETKIEGNVATISGGCHEAFIDALVEVDLEGVERIVVRVPQRVRPSFRDMLAKTPAYESDRDRLWGEMYWVVFYFRNELKESGIDTKDPRTTLEFLERRFNVPVPNDETAKKQYDNRVHRILWANVVHNVVRPKIPVRMIY